MYPWDNFGTHIDAGATVPTFSKRGDRWQAKVRRRGYPPQSETFRTKGLAEKWARDIEAKIDAGKFVATSREAERDTLGEAIDRYLRDVTAHKRNSRPEELKLKAIKGHAIAARTLASLRSADFAKLRDDLRSAGLKGKPLAANTVRLYLAPLSHLFTVAREEWGYEGLDNPLLSVKKPSTVGTERKRRAEGKELPQILKAAKAVATWAPAAIELAVETAMRRGEMARLRWEHIDTKARVAHLPETKNGEARDVPLSPRALAIVQGLAKKKRKDGFVFGVHPDTLSDAFIQARTAAKVEGLRLHDLRREATSRLFERGDLSIVEVSAITGHKTLQMLRVYSAPRASDIARKLAKTKP